MSVELKDIVIPERSSYDEFFEVVQVWAIKDINGQKYLSGYETKEKAEEEKKYSALLDMAYNNYIINLFMQANNIKSRDEAGRILEQLANNKLAEKAET